MVAKRQSSRGTTSETEVSLQKHKIGKREYKCTQQDLHHIYLHMPHYQQRGWWSLTAASQL